MQVDRYTKSILTVIAACLILLVLKTYDVVPNAEATNDRGENVVKVQIVSIDESPSLAWESLHGDVR